MIITVAEGLCWAASLHSLYRKVPPARPTVTVGLSNESLTGRKAQNTLHSVHRTNSKGGGYGSL
ncbi:hypothetical protein JZ751_002263 [Albula glossodonta]|uniref:Uncharacterized protein n=1 Tax=Albula glossodonta TaxID=121402 RepID=A0A8T2PI77_9TELE|nr:hypothetical protein JZ751_002263 [Albula glossodonta]